MSEFLSPQEAAKQLGLHRWTIYSWIKKGILPAYRIGDQIHGRVRLRRSDIDRLLKRIPVKNDDGDQILEPGHEEPQKSG